LDKKKKLATSEYWVRMLQRLVVAASLMFSLLTVSVTLDSDRPAFACSCLGIQPQQEAFEGSQVVFSGRAVDLEITNETYPSVIATFDINTIWKGNITKDPLVLTTGMGGADCGYVFEKNEEYLVYAYGKEGELGATSCSRTTPLERAEADLVFLGSGDGKFSGEVATFAVFPYLVIGAVVAAGAVVGAIVLVKKRKRATGQMGT
jgi:hypothetical protein